MALSIEQHGCNTERRYYDLFELSVLDLNDSDTVARIAHAILYKLNVNKKKFSYIFYLLHKKNLRCLYNYIFST